jgi:hypothetical protein
MLRTCPECAGDLTDLDPAAEMGSAAKRYDRRECALRFVSDASGTLLEVDG